MPNNADCPVQFSDQDSTSGIAKIFEIGEYPDKDFVLTEAEADEAIADFSPVPNDLEHKKTILSGKLGALESVFRRGREIFGQISIPKWLRDLNGDEPIKVSLAWSRGVRKRIVGNALVLNPRISDAQVFAAFSVEEHRAEASSSSLCADKKGGTNVPKSKYLERFLAVFSWPAVVEEFAKLDEDPEGVSGKGFPETTGAEAETAEPDSDARFAAQQEQMNALQCRLLDNEAEKFYLLALSECRVVPAERETLIAQFKQAVADDNAPEVSGRGRPETTASVSGKGFPETTSVACFSADGVLNEGSRLTLLKAGVAARPKHDLSSERLESLIKDKGEIVAFEANPKSTDDPEAKKLTKERRKELIDAGTIKVG